MGSSVQSAASPVTSQAHHGRNRGAWVSRPEEAVHLLRLLPQPPSERGHPLVLYLEPGLVWLGPLPQYPSLLGSSSSPKQHSTHWKPTHQHLHGHHTHLCNHLCFDGSHCWIYWGSSHALSQWMDLAVGFSWKPGQWFSSLAACPCLPPLHVGCSIYWARSV